jgi:general secretion pathway protein G
MLICRPRFPRTCVHASRNLGFTLIELMVVLLILALLSTIAAPRVARSLGKAKTQTARIQVDALSAAVDAFVLDVGRPPLQSEGLNALVAAPSQLENWDGPYIKKQQSLVDPWGQPYQYSQPGEHGEYDVFTLAADKQAGGSGDGSDIGNW